MRKFFQVKAFGCDVSRRASVSVHPARFGHIIDNILSQDDSFIWPLSSSPSSSYVEIHNYLKHHFKIDPNCFNILEWWKENSIKFPMWLRIAKKKSLQFRLLLVVLKSVFSTGKIVLDEKRCHLTQHTIQICVCKKYWDQTEHNDSRTMTIKKKVSGNTMTRNRTGTHLRIVLTWAPKKVSGELLWTILTHVTCAAIIIKVV